jgi:CATRA-Associated Small Protein
VPNKLHRDLDTAQNLLTNAINAWNLSQPAWEFAFDQLDAIAEAVTQRDQEALNEAVQRLEAIEPNARGTRVDGPAQSNAPDKPFIARVSELVHDLGTWKTAASDTATSAKRSAKDVD